MKTTMKTLKMVCTWMPLRSVGLAVGTALLASFAVACTQEAGSRCNPATSVYAPNGAYSHDECDNGPTYQCVQPVAAACNGEAYCCAVDPNSGNITSTEPNCLFLVSCQAPTPDAGTPDSDSPTPADAGGGG